jgi:hypothetical protein
MLKSIKKMYYSTGAIMMLGLTNSSMAFAADANTNNFNKISQNIGASISDAPGLLSGLAYIAGTGLGVLGVMKIKDHVENPGNTKLKDGAIRLVAGGALFALPMIYEAMSGTIGSGTAVSAPSLKKATFSVN